MSDAPKQQRQLLLLTLSAAAMLMLITLIMRFNDQGQLLEEPNTALAGPDFQIKGFDLHQYDLKGQLSYQVTADQVFHYPSNDTTELKSPAFAQQNESGSPVVGSADLGVILSKGDTIHLRGNAVLKQTAYGRQQELIARSDYFTYYPDKHFAETEAPVSFTSPGSTMTGIGMAADFNSKILNLKAKVNGTHATK